MGVRQFRISCIFCGIAVVSSTWSAFAVHVAVVAAPGVTSPGSRGTEKVEPMDFNDCRLACRSGYFVCGRHMDRSRGERTTRGARQGTHRRAARRCPRLRLDDRVRYAANEDLDAVSSVTTRQRTLHALGTTNLRRAPPPIVIYPRDHRRAHAAEATHARAVHSAPAGPQRQVDRSQRASRPQ